MATAFAFKDARTLPADKKPARKAVTKNRRRVQFAYVEQLAHLVQVQEAAKAAAAIIEEKLKEQAFEEFIGDIVDKGTRPEEFDAVDVDGGPSSIQMQFRRRSVSSPLVAKDLVELANSLHVNDRVDHSVPQTPEQFTALVRALEKRGVVLHKTVVQQELYAIDPEVAGDIEKMKRVEQVLAENGLTHIIVRQPEIFSYTVSETLVDTLCNIVKNTNAQQGIQAIRTCSVLGSKLNAGTQIDPNTILNTMRDFLAFNEVLKMEPEVARRELSSRMASKKPTTRRAALLTADK